MVFLSELPVRRVTPLPIAEKLTNCLWEHGVISLQQAALRDFLT